MSLYYQDEHVTLYHGDCLTEHREWLDADVLVTDPPYGRDWKQGELKGHKRNQASAGILNDAGTSARDDMLAAWNSKGAAIVFGDLMLPPPAGNKQTCVYYKQDATTGLRGAMGGVRRDAEAIYLVGKWPSGIGGRSSVFVSNRMITGASGAVAKNGGHPHTKPGDIMETLIGICPEGVIADPFSGGGSTLVAARNLGRKAVGVEVEERYCEIIASRLSQGALDLAI